MSVLTLSGSLKPGLSIYTIFVNFLNYILFVTAFILFYASNFCSLFGFLFYLDNVYFIRLFPVVLLP